MSRERDRQLEYALKHQLRAGATPAAATLRTVDEENCLDAETLAAWEDGGLDAAAMASIEAHVSNCGRCQALLGTAARSSPAPSAKAPGTFLLWRWWLAPLAAGAAAVTLWMVVPQQREIALAPPVASTTPEIAPSKPFDSAQGKAAAEPAAANEARAKEKAEQTPPPERSERANKALSTVEDRRERSAEALQEKRPDVAAKKDDADVKLMRDEAKVAGAAAAPAAAAASPPAAPSPSEPAVGALQKNGRLAFAPIEIATPNPAIRWRIIGGTIERSENSGRIWIPVRPSAGEIITGGTAPSESIAWFYGSSGVVLVTADGQAFARVPLPERVDITAITATDARTATVTTTDGRRFTTTDSGRTWRQIQA